MSPGRRRANLIDWIASNSLHDGLTAQEIVDVSGLYDEGNGRYDTCLRDLQALQRNDLLERSGGRPACWSLVVWTRGPK